MKEALQKETDRVMELEKELEKNKCKRAELEAELKDKEHKFLDFYMENTQQHEKIVELQIELQSALILSEVKNPCMILIHRNRKNHQMVCRLK